MFQPMGCGAEFAPPTSSPLCTGLGQGAICEAAELPLYLRPVDVCMRVDGVSAPILLWNAVNQDWSSPLEVELGPRPYATNGSDGVVSGVFLRADDGVHYLGEVAPGATVPVDDASTVLMNQTQLIDAVRAELLSQGLSDNEANDFIDAWRPDQLAFPPPWTAFGFFDAETIEARAPLTLVPEPVESVRVLAFVAD